MRTFEEIICSIDNAISIKKEDREVYAKDFDIIRNYLLHIMQEEDPVFKKICSGPSFFGSYAENMKIDVPDEFDVNFPIELPFYEQIEIEHDIARPGFVMINLSKVLPLMKANPDFFSVYLKFEGFVKKRKYLCRTLVQKWLEKIILQALTIHGKTIKSSTGEDYTLHYWKKGLSHTIEAGSTKRNISIDFVPAFRFSADSKWFADRPFPRDTQEKLWFAVPKPTVGLKHGRVIKFTICVPQTEKDLLTKKNNLKISLRLFKSLRNGRVGYPLTSYFIRSVYLNENDKQSDDFWIQPPGRILIHMINRVLDYLNDGFMPFYWCPSLNLLGGLDKYQIMEIKIVLERIKDILQSYCNQPKVNEHELKRLFDISAKPLSKEYS